MIVSELNQIYWYDEFLGREWLLSLEDWFFFSFKSGFIDFFILLGVKLIW